MSLTRDTCSAVTWPSRVESFASAVSSQQNHYISAISASRGFSGDSGDFDFRDLRCTIQTVETSGFSCGDSRVPLSPLINPSAPCSEPETDLFDGLLVPLLPLAAKDRWNSGRSCGDRHFRYLRWTAEIVATSVFSCGDNGDRRVRSWVRSVGGWR